MALERRLQLVATGAETPEMEPAVKVAFATRDMKWVDQHFGAAESFAVYALNSEQATLAEAAQFGPEVMNGYEDDGPRGSLAAGKKSPSRPSGSGHNENRLAAKLEALDGCVAVYCQAVGASAINQLRAKGIQAVKVASDSRIKDLVQALQQELRAGPNGWLARAVEQHKPRDARRFDDMEQEGWGE